MRGDPCDPVDPEAFVRRLAAARIGATHNQYRLGLRAPLLRERLVGHLEERAGARIVLVGEAPGYRGARVSGVPFTSERQISGTGPAEATATIVRRALLELGAADDVMLWNVVPTHPGTATSNRPPTAAEIAGARPFLLAVCAGRIVVPVGRVAERACGLTGLRHPSRGGAAAFREGLTAALEAARTGRDAPSVRPADGTATLHRRLVTKAAAS